MPQTPRYDKQRAKVTPPHVSLQALRMAAGLTLDAVCERMAEETGKPFSRGALSAIENGLRGASVPTLNALCVAYGLRPGDINTTYEPRQRDAVA